MSQEELRCGDPRDDLPCFGGVVCQSAPAALQSVPYAAPGGMVPYPSGDPKVWATQDPKTLAGSVAGSVSPAFRAMGSQSGGQHSQAHMSSYILGRSPSVPAVQPDGSGARALYHSRVVHGACSAPLASAKDLKGREHAASCYPTPIPPYRPASSYATLSTRSSIGATESSEEERSCVVCLSAEKTHAFVPCGHRCVCFCCGSSVLKGDSPTCPICRAQVGQMIKIFT